jgi:acetyltransferase-like isoleucine patch superfamily enzyme
MKAIVFGLVFIAPPFLKKVLLKWFCKAKFGKQSHIGWFSAMVGERIRMDEFSVVRPFTLINLDGEIMMGAYSEISSFCLVYGSSSLRVGDGSYIGPQSLINVEDEVVIGRESAIGARGMVFTHGSFLPYTEGYFIKLNGVTLGDRVWCAAGVFLSPGVEVGSNSFVNSGSVVTHSIPEGSVAEGNPAKVIYPMNKVKREMTLKHVDLALERILKEFSEVCLQREYKIEIKEAKRDRLIFAWRGRQYCICIIPSTAQPDEYAASPNFDKRICLVNSSVWKPARADIIFDLQLMQTVFKQDRIQEALRVFTLRYFGLRFRNNG